MRHLPAGTGSRGYRKVLVAGGAGTVIEVYDLLIYGYLAAILARQFFPSSDPTAISRPGSRRADITLRSGLAACFQWFQSWAFG